MPSFVSVASTVRIRAISSCMSTWMKPTQRPTITGRPISRCSRSKTGAFDVAVFHKVNRNARNEYDYYANKAKLLHNGVSIEYAGQSFDGKLNSNADTNKAHKHYACGL